MSNPSLAITIPHPLKRQASMLVVLDGVRYQSELYWSLYLNAVRDAVWTVLSADQIGLPLKSNNFLAQLLSQLVFSSGAMALAAIFMGFIIRYSKKQLPTAEIAAIWLAASLSIFTWDLGQALGIERFSDYCSPVQASYAAALLTGGFEGPTQHLVGTAVRLGLDAEARKGFQKKSYTYHGIELLFSLLPGSLPGAVWQLLYTCGMDQNFSPYFTAFLVMTGVCISNYAVNRSSNWIMRYFTKSTSQTEETLKQSLLVN